MSQLRAKSQVKSERLIAVSGTRNEETEVAENVDKDTLLGTTDNEIPLYQEPKDEGQNKGKYPTKRPNNQKDSRKDHTLQASHQVPEKRKEHAQNPFNKG